MWTGALPATLSTRSIASGNRPGRKARIGSHRDAVDTADETAVRMQSSAFHHRRGLAHWHIATGWSVERVGAALRHSPDRGRRLRRLVVRDSSECESASRFSKRRCRSLPTERLSAWPHWQIDGPPSSNHRPASGGKQSSAMGMVPPPLPDLSGVSRSCAPSASQFVPVLRVPALHEADEGTLVADRRARGIGIQP